jgi:hypothetical protein
VKEIPAAKAKEGRAKKPGGEPPKKDEKPAELEDPQAIFRRLFEVEQEPAFEPDYGGLSDVSE